MNTNIISRVTMVMMPWRQYIFARETKKVSKRGFISFCYKFALQILPAQTLNFSTETLIKKMHGKKVSIKHTIKDPKTFPVVIVIFSSI